MGFQGTVKPSGGYRVGLFSVGRDQHFQTQDRGAWQESFADVGTDSNAQQQSPEGHPKYMISLEEPHVCIKPCK